MASHTATTLNIDDSVMARLGRKAARSGQTMLESVETTLRRLLETRLEPADLLPIPTF